MEIRPSNVGASVDAAQPAARDAPVAARQDRPAEADLIPTYSNAIIRISPEAGLAVMEIRDGLNGEVRFQYPAEQVVREYEHAAKPAQGGAELSGATRAAGETTERGAGEAEAKNKAGSQPALGHTKLIG